MLNEVQNTTADYAVNDIASGDHHVSDTPIVEPSGVSTPIAFVPTQPTQEDHIWPLLLEESLNWFISAVRETSTRAHSTTSLPADTIDQSQMCTSKEQTGSSPINESRPANRATIHHHATHSDGMTTGPTSPPVNMGTTDYQLDPPGDSVMLTPPHVSGSSTNKAPETTTEHPDWQSPPPPQTAQLTLEQSSCPPDEDPTTGPKRVAVSDLRSQPQSPPNNDHHTTHPNYESSHSTTDITATIQYASVVHPPSSFISRHRAEPEANPRPMIQEENMGMPASQPTKRLSIAHTPPLELPLTNLNKLITKNLYTIHKMLIHHKNISYDISHNHYWSKIKSMFHTDSSQEIEEIVQPTIDCLLHPVDSHYSRMIDARHQLIVQQISNTYHSITANNREDPSLTAARMVTSITNLIHQLREQQMPTHVNTTIASYTIGTNMTTSLTVDHSDIESTTTTDSAIHDTDSLMLTPASNHTNTPSDSHNLTDHKNRKSLRTRNKNKETHTPEQCTAHNCYDCAVNNIVNLSDIQLTKTQILLLNRGLSFVPTADNATPVEIIKEFDIFANKAKRKLRLMVNPPRPPRPNEEPALFRIPSTTNTTPHVLGPRPLEDTFETIKLEISKMTQHPTTNYNLTRKERLALKELASNRDLVINKADKGSTIVVRHRLDYITEGLEHLSDANTYLELDGDYTIEINKIIRDTLQKFRTQGLLSPRMTEYCLPPATPRTALIYFLKKIHKSPMGIRPIVSTVNSPTANLAEFLDHYLQPIMKSLPAYLKDTTQFLQEIANIKITRDTWLVTVDVKSLYTNIPNDEGIQACYEAWLKQETSDPQHPPAEVLRHLLELVLKLNTFEFNNKYYLQKFGTAMGSKLAPAYANTFMGQLEKDILESSPLQPTYYRRFIDDIFMIWPHSLKDLQCFIAHMNRANRSIQFTHEYSQEEIVFLDVVVYKDTTKDKSTNTLHTRTHIKPTNKQLYVREDSYHPPGTGKGVTIGEAIRFLRTNSKKDQFSKMILQHKRNLTKRGYNTANTNRLLKQIKFNQRRSRALKTNHKNTKHTATPIEKRKPTFVTRYCPNAKKAFRIVHKHWTSIDTDIPVLKKFLSCTPRMAYRANPNLAKRLVRAKLRPPTPHCNNASVVSCNNKLLNINTLANLTHPVTPDSTGHYSVTHCGNRRCPLHTRLMNSRRVRSRISRRTYHTHGQVTCDTPNIVYLIQCRICGRQYVGQTQQSLKARFAKHLQAIRDRHRPGVLQEHFRRGECAGVENIRIQLLHAISNTDSTPEDTEESLKQLETLWIDRLKCEYPQGLNWVRYDPMRRHHRQTQS